MDLHPHPPDFLTVNRIALFGGQRGAGWSAELTTPDAVLLVPAYLGVAALAYLTIAQSQSAQAMITEAGCTVCFLPDHS